MKEKLKNELLRNEGKPNSKCKKTNAKGITLVALVITVIVLLILAGAAVSSALNQGQIFSNAKRAKEEWNAKVEEEEAMNQTISDLMATPSVPTTGKITSAHIGTVISNSVNAKLTDEYDNKVTIPAGFKIVSSGTNNASYTYNTTTPGVPAVQDGIVVEDETTHNQFVWIPVGEVTNKDGTTFTVPFARYQWSSEYDNGTYNYTATPTQTAASLLANNNSTTDIYYVYDAMNTGIIFHELVQQATSPDGKPSNQVAKNLVEFINSAINNGGYYIARYEAGVEEFDKTKTDAALKARANYQEAIDFDSSLKDYSYSANWTGYVTANDTTPNVVSKPGKQVWNYITQPKAAEVARNMYSNSANYVSDLANSFAWDTAIVFLSQYSGKVDYASQNYGPSSKLEKSGESLETACNILDLSGNYAEWSTENYTEYDGENYTYPSSSVLRGGCYIEDYQPVNMTLSRNVSPIDANNYSITFRPIVYMK